MFDKKFFTSNRVKLSKLLPKHMLFVSANAMLQSSADLAFPFRQDSNFWYLTGLKNPDAVLVIDTLVGESILLLPEQNAYQMEWDGQYDHEALMSRSGLDRIESMDSLQQYVKRASSHNLTVGMNLPPPDRVEPYGFYSNPARKILDEKIKSINPRVKSESILRELSSLRQVKQPEEMNALLCAINVTAETLDEVHSSLADFKTEKEVENAITAGFYMRNSQGHAYEPIVACGRNASIIHYNKNTDMLSRDALLLLDVGATVDGYASDISRTWAIGKPTKRQQELYKCVIDLQNQAFDLLKVGVLLRDYQHEMEKRAKKLFHSLGIDIDTYPHGFSHFLGLDVHDAGLYDEPLQEGAVVTVEPGIYLPEEGMGIRIEDNVQITKNGIKNLSEIIPKML